MSRVVVVATFKAKEGKEAELLEGLKGLVENSHMEAGCLTYALHEETLDPGRYILVENWTSQVALDAHFLQPYIQDAADRGDELLSEPPVVRFCTPIDAGDPAKGSL
jgi:quinol monooxygenase YgiN